MDHHLYLFKQAAVASRLARLIPGSITAGGGVNPLSYEGKMPSLLRRALYRASLPNQRVGEGEAAQRLSRFMGLAGAQSPELGAGLSRVARFKGSPAPAEAEDLMKSWIRMNRKVFGGTEAGRGILSRASRYAV